MHFEVVSEGHKFVAVSEASRIVAASKRWKYAMLKYSIYFFLQQLQIDLRLLFLLHFDLFLFIVSIMKLKCSVSNVKKF
jgi:hypothetical protein